MMSARAIGAWGAGVTAVLVAVSGVLINQWHSGWPWRVAAGAVVLISAALAAWLALRSSDGSPAGGEGDRLGPGAVKAGRDIRGDVTTSVGVDAGQPPTAAPVTATPWSLGPGAAIEAGRDINGPVHVTIINGTFDLLNNAIFDPGRLESVLDLAHFTGREWLIDRIDAYIAKEPCGYVVVEAEAGVGKSALAAHLVWTRPCAYHFTRLPGGQSPKEARRSLAAQLIGAWRLHDLAPGDTFPAVAERPDWLLKVLQAAAARRDATRPGQPLVLIVDGLDEAADASGHGHDTGTGIPLGLPRPEHLPRGVFIVATSRFGTRLPALYGPVARYPITVKGPDNLADMRRFVTNAVTGVSPQQRLVDILAAHHVDPQSFVESLLERCGGVWVHLRYMLSDILAERHSPADVHRLPGQLIGYYLEQVGRWRDAEGWQHLGLPVVATLVALRRSAARAEIANLAAVLDGDPLSRWLDEAGLRPFLDVTPGPHDRRLYAIRHETLRELFAPSDTFDEGDGTRETLHEALLAAHRRITAALIPSGLPAERDWKAVDDYTRVSLAEHAAHSGRLDELACDPGFLLVCDPASLLRHRASVTIDDARAGIAAYELVLDQWAHCDRDDLRLWWLHVWAHKTRSHSLADRTAAHHHSDWQVVTAMWTGSSHRTLTGHTEPVSAVCALPLRKRTLLASAGHDGIVRLWDPDAGTQVGQLIGYAEPVNALCALMLPDGRGVLASGGVDGTVRLWDPGSGEPASPPLTGHTGEVSAVCALPLRKRTLLASAGRDGIVRLWDPDAGTQVSQLINDKELVNALCALMLMLPDRRRVLACGGVDGTVRLWDPDSGEQVGRTLTGHTGEVSSVCAVTLPDDGRSVLASAGLDGTVRLWDPDRGEPVGLPLAGHTDVVRAVCAVPLLNGRGLLASAGRDRVLRLWNPAGGAQIGQPMVGHTDEVSAVCALTLPDRRGLLASAGHDRVLRLWDPHAGAQVGQPLAGHTDEVSAVCAVLLPDGRTLLASAGRDRVLRLWNPAGGAQVGQPLAGHTDGVSAVCAVPLPGGRTVLASGGVDGTVRLWDPVRREQVGPPLEGHTDRVMAVCALTLPDHGSSVLASASLDRTVRLWDPDSGEQVGPPLEGHTDWVSAVCAVVLPDGRTRLASAGHDRVLRLWDPDSGKEAGRPLAGHTDGVSAVCAVPLPGGRTLLASADPRVLRLWDPDSGEQVGPPLVGHNHGVSAVCAVPLLEEHFEGRTVLACGGVDGTVRLWDPKRGEQVGSPLTGHTGRVTAICPLPGPEDHTRIATAGEDRTVLVWNLSGLDWALRS